LSGKDEEPIRDIPICPRCGKMPTYWTLYPTMNQTAKNGWFWLHSDSFIKRNPIWKKLSPQRALNSGYPRLGNIVCVICTDSKHVFTAEHLTFQKVLQKAKRLDGER
jgi:hypothetical protein